MHLPQKQPEQLDSSPIGRIVSITGANAIVQLDRPDRSAGNARFTAPEIGTLIKIETVKNTICLAVVSSLNVPVPTHSQAEPELWLAELELVGELDKLPDGSSSRFYKGVTTYPSLGGLVFKASHEELKLMYPVDKETSVQIGHLHQDPAIPVSVSVDDLLGKHFAVLGTTGTGKSCSVTLILRAILKNNSHAHIVLLDPHNEYSQSFGNQAETISPEDFLLPFWLFTFAEIVQVMIGSPEKHETEINLLAELIPEAKGLYLDNPASTGPNIYKRRLNDVSSISVDTPIPYRISDMLNLISQRMGLLENKKEIGAYKKIKSRLESLSKDVRYNFMFGNNAMHDSMAEILARILRIPVNSKPISIIELTGLPSEIVNVVVSVLCRMTFDFALWSDGKVPVTLVCEEAHRYIPADDSLGFAPTKKSISRIAKEGRKYGVSLCLVSQRPSELDPTILSQCNTVFSMRLSNDHDQRIVQAAISDSASSLLTFLPSLGSQEAIAFGDGLSVPVRMRFGQLPADAMPKGSSAKFSKQWSKDITEDGYMEAVVKRWRSSSGGQKPRYTTLNPDVISRNQSMFGSGT